jgi:hypothetical protein
LPSWPKIAIEKWPPSRPFAFPATKPSKMAKSTEDCHRKMAAFASVRLAGNQAAEDAQVGQRFPLKSGRLRCFHSEKPTMSWLAVLGK